jgi:hypothetical protein
MQSLYQHLPLIVAVIMLCGFTASAIASFRNRDPIGWFALGCLFGIFAIYGVVWLRPVPPDRLR